MLQQMKLKWNDSSRAFLQICSSGKIYVKVSVYTLLYNIVTI